MAGFIINTSLLLEQCCLLKINSVNEWDKEKELQGLYSHENKST